MEGKCGCCREGVSGMGYKRGAGNAARMERRNKIKRNMASDEGTAHDIVLYEKRIEREQDGIEVESGIGK